MDHHDLNSTQKETSQVLVVIPTYNEAENISRIVPAVLAEVPEAHILVVDDASPDGTGALADDLAARDERVHVLHRTSKDGLGRAYVAGFEWALERRYAFIFEFDADFSHDPACLPGMLSREAEFDVVIGSRYVEGGGTQNWPWHRKLVSRGGGLYARSVLGTDIQDLTSGFIGWRRHVLEAIDLASVEASGYGFQIEMKYRAAKAGFRVLEYPITFADREAGESKMSPKIFAEALGLVWRLRFSGRTGS